jgi:dipeptidase E
MIAGSHYHIGFGVTRLYLPTHISYARSSIASTGFLEDITFRDSMGHTFYAIPDGTYLFKTDETEEIRGQYWRISDGKMTDM